MCALAPQTQVQQTGLIQPHIMEQHELRSMVVGPLLGGAAGAALGAAFGAAAGNAGLGAATGAGAGLVLGTAAGKPRHDLRYISVHLSRPYRLVRRGCRETI